MTDQPKTLQEMTPEEAAPIMEAWRTGKPLITRYGYESRPYPRVGIYLGVSYLLPSEPTVHPALWGVVPEWCNYIAQDENGEIWGFSHPPEPDGIVWVSDSEVVREINLSPDALSWPKDTPWQERIIKRPKGGL